MSGSAKLVFISNDDKNVQDMFLNRDWGVTFDAKKADLICFTGGADISPYLYGERPMPKTNFSAVRDNREIRIWKGAKVGTPKVGICRGAQLGNVLCGGSLYQHVDGHTSTHMIKDKTGLWQKAGGRLIATSHHHQMCRVTKEAYVMAVANKSSLREYEGGRETYGMTRFNDWTDIEAFYYDNFNFMGVQFHPEWDTRPDCTDYFFKLMDFCYDFGTDEAVSDVQETEELKARLLEERID